MEDPQIGSPTTYVTSIDAPQTSGDGLWEHARERATASLGNQKDRALDGLDTVAQAVRDSTKPLRDKQYDTVAGYIEQAADQIEQVARRLREKDIAGFVDEVQKFAKRQPAVFVGSAFALGLISARFLKSSSPRGV